MATRYAGDGGAESRLVAKVKTGGAGAWGAIPMPAQPQIKDADARASSSGFLAARNRRRNRRLAVIFTVIDEAERTSKDEHERRDVLSTGGGVTLLSLVAAAGWLRPGEALRGGAGTRPRSRPRSMDETVKALGGGAPAQSKDITFFQTPDIAENGAVVPVGVTSAIPKTESIAILVEKNPNMLAAVFDIPAGTEPSLSTRMKMGQSSNVYALVKADGKYYVAVEGNQGDPRRCGGRKLRRKSWQIR